MRAYDSHHNADAVYIILLIIYYVLAAYDSHNNRHIHTNGPTLRSETNTTVQGTSLWTVIVHCGEEMMQNVICGPWVGCVRWGWASRSFALLCCQI
jgi:hypothetical protein